MKTKLTAAILISLATAAVHGQDASERFRRLDKNRDGFVTRDELPEQLRPNFDRVDTNRDGKISADEDAAFVARGNRLQPQRQQQSLPEGVRKLADMAYVKEGHERQVLDLYLPKSTGQPRPLVIWVHGGGWRQGEKAGGPWRPLLEKGFAVASINYRLSQHAVFPAQINDCKAAVRWLRMHAEEYELDPNRFGAWGSSAGGHLVAMLGTSGDVAELEGNENGGVSSRVQAVCDWFGPTDFTQMNSQAGDKGTIDHDSPDSPEALLIGGTVPKNPEKARIASPITYVSADDPEFLIVHGDEDRLVPLQQSQLLQQAFEKAGVRSQLVVVPDAGHGQFRDPQITQDCVNFFERVLGSK